MVKLFKKFYKKQRMWSSFVTCIAELDCLCSLAIFAKEEALVKPEVVDFADNGGKPLLEIDGLSHVCVAKTVKEFVTNDL